MALDLTFRGNAASLTRGAALAAAIIGASAFAARAEAPLPAPPKVATTQGKPLLDQRECVKLLSMASTEFAAAGQGKDKTYNPEFPETLAAFIAPSNPKPVQDLIVNGTFKKFSASQAPDDIKKKQAMIPTITCDGSPYIVVEGRGIAMWLTIEDFYYQSKTTPIDLKERGIKPIGRAEFMVLKRPKAGAQSQVTPVPPPPAPRS